MDKANGDVVSIRYVFRFPDGRKRSYMVRLDAQSGDLVDDLPAKLPRWTALHYEQCGNCPLRPEPDARCPLAAHLVGLISICQKTLSYDEVRLHVVTRERIVSKDTTAQKAVSALMGLIMATCGCPVTSFLKPMARFHLPLASEEETIYRATSMYLLGQYFLRQDGGEADLKLSGLEKIYRDLQVLNSAMAKRIRSGIREDAAANAIVLLDFFAKSLPYAVEESLDDMRRLFAAYVASETERDSGYAARPAG